MPENIDHQDRSVLTDLCRASTITLRARWAGTPLTTHLLQTIHRAMADSAALHPGRLRTPDQNIGVTTPYGRHTPPALTWDQVTELLTPPDNCRSARHHAATVFARLAAAQPFEDGNKRSALLAAQVLLPDGEWMPVPLDADGEGAAVFHDLLARYYMFEDPTVIDYLAGE